MCAQDDDVSGGDDHGANVGEVFGDIGPDQLRYSTGSSGSSDVLPALEDSGVTSVSSSESSGGVCCVCEDSLLDCEGSDEDLDSSVLVIGMFMITILRLFTCLVINSLFFRFFSRGFSGGAWGCGRCRRGQFSGGALPVWAFFLR